MHVNSNSKGGIKYVLKQGGVTLARQESPLNTGEKAQVCKTNGATNNTHRPMFCGNFEDSPTTELICFLLFSVENFSEITVFLSKSLCCWSWVNSNSYLPTCLWVLMLMFDGRGFYVYIQYLHVCNSPKMNCLFDLKWEFV